MMLHIPEVLSADQVRHIRAELDRADWVDGRATVGDQGAKVKRNRQLPEHSPVGLKLGEIILDALRKNPLFFAAALPKKTMPPLFNSYEGGEHYGLHVDGWCATCLTRPASPSAPTSRPRCSCPRPKSTKAASWSWSTPTAPMKSSCRPAT